MQESDKVRYRKQIPKLLEALKKKKYDAYFFETIEEARDFIPSQIQAKETEIQELEKIKPDSTDEIEYDKEQHVALKTQCDTIQEESSSIKEGIDHDTGTIKQLEKDLTRLKPDFELFPQLEDDVRARRDKIKILKLVKVQLSETSKELRNKVLPHARLIINQILPTLTGDRYSDFEITEIFSICDLVYAMYPKIRDYVVSIPVKVLYAARFRKRFITSNFGEMKSLAIKLPLGVAVNPVADEINDALMKLVTEVPATSEVNLKEFEELWWENQAVKLQKSFCNHFR